MDRRGPATSVPHVGLKRRIPLCKPPPVGAGFSSQTSRSPPPLASQALPPLPCSASTLSSSLSQQPAFFLAAGAKLTSPARDQTRSRHALSVGGPVQAQCGEHAGAREAVLRGRLPTLCFCLGCSVTLVSPSSRCPCQREACPLPRLLSHRLSAFSGLGHSGGERKGLLRACPGGD